MNIPPNARIVSTDTQESPQVIKPENLRYHQHAYGLDRPVVMFGYSQSTGGYGAGTHDGMRDGASSGPLPTHFRGYCSLADWLAAGNTDPS